MGSHANHFNVEGTFELRQFPGRRIDVITVTQLPLRLL